MQSKCRTSCSLYSRIFPCTIPFSILGASHFIAVEENKWAWIELENAFIGRQILWSSKGLNTEVNQWMTWTYPLTNISLLKNDFMKTNDRSDSGTYWLILSNLTFAFFLTVSLLLMKCNNSWVVFSETLIAFKMLNVPSLSWWNFCSEQYFFVPFCLTCLTVPSWTPLHGLGMKIRLTLYSPDPNVFLGILSFFLFLPRKSYFPWAKTHQTLQKRTAPGLKTALYYYFFTNTALNCTKGNSKEIHTVTSTTRVGGLLSAYSADFHKTSTEDGSWPRIDPIHFWYRSR